MGAIHGEKLRLEQENGQPVSLFVSGDEFYARHETLEGFTVVYDKTQGLYCYADVIQGRFRSSGIPIHKRPPLGTRKHLQESSDVRAAKFEHQFSTLYPRKTPHQGPGHLNFTLGNNDGLMTGRKVCTGNVKGLTILVEFQDVRTSITTDHVDALLNGENYRENGNVCSVREYFDTISNKKLNYTNTVIGPVRLSQNQRYYETTPLMREALLIAIQKFNLSLADFDSRNEGVVDAVSFMYAGRTVYGINGDDNRPSWLWPHNSELNFQHRGTRTNYYQISSLGRSPLELTIGTFCHESGHMLCRFPDLYDYGRRDNDFNQSTGLSSYCLMSSGNHLNMGRTPAPVCGYLRDLAGWPDASVDLSTSGHHEITQGDYSTIYKCLTDNSNEYFIVENRSGFDLDEYLPSSGLAVFHCDTQGSNEWQQGTAQRHYQCALLQADGRRDLENNYRGDRTDLFSSVPGVAVSDTTSPSSREWDGSDSGLILRQISESGKIMTFYSGEHAVRPQPGIVSEESFPDLFIPDNTPQGVNTQIPLSGSGTIKSIKVSVDILHAYQGDLRLELTSPKGTQILLHNAHRQSGHDLKKTFDSNDHADLEKLLGESYSGLWTLTVKDLLRQDTGRLNHWDIELEFEPHEQIIEKSTRPDLIIPDNYPTGVTSRIDIQENGTLKAIEVEMDISHTFIRDLRLELIAPTGHSVFLHNREGGSNDDILTTYDTTSAPELESFLNIPIAGEWTLSVKDLEGGDEGQLNFWSLKITYEG